jgi:hypothetical protein
METTTGARLIHKRSGQRVTLIRKTGPSTGIVRFDVDAAYNKKHGLAPSSGDIEFDISDFTAE